MKISFRYYKRHTARKRINGRDTILDGGDSVSKDRALKENAYEWVKFYECFNSTLAAGCRPTTVAR